jgi:hypothetical protein
LGYHFWKAQVLVWDRVLAWDQVLGGVLVLDGVRDEALALGQVLA